LLLLSGFAREQSRSSNGADLPLLHAAACLMFGTGAVEWQQFSH